jgi:hypothetical protein
LENIQDFKIQELHLSFRLFKNFILSTSQSGNESKEIPEWIKNNAKWWAEGAIDDDAFVQGIEFLVKEGIIQV